MQDHLNCSLACELRSDIPTRDVVLKDPEFHKASVLEYERSRTGRLAEGPAYNFAFTPLQILETPSETQELTEAVKQYVEEEASLGLRTQYSVIQKAVESPSEATGTTVMIRMQRHRDLESLPKGTPAFVDGKYVTVITMLAHPFSRGSCHITSYPSQKPEIKFNYLSHPLDAEIMARHLRLVDRLFERPTFTDMRKPDGRRLPLSFPEPITSPSMRRSCFQSTQQRTIIRAALAR